MTCIVGFVDKGSVYIGGDSAGVSGHDMTLRADEKVFRNKDFIFGFTSSFRMGQILRYNFIPPNREPFVSDEHYLYNDFMDALIAILKKKGYLKIENNQLEGGTFLLGYRGKLYYIGSDFQIGRNLKEYNSVGCGSSYAIGAMHALDNYLMLPKERIELALKAAEAFSTGVSRPFKVISI